MSTLADIFSQGISAYAEVQKVRYQPNNPTPNVQTPAGQSTPAGESLRTTVADTVKNPTNLLLLGVVAVLVVFLVRR